jgi:hypothetical protein
MLVLGRDVQGEVVEVESESHIDELMWQKTRSVVVIHVRLQSGRAASIRGEHLLPDGHALLERWIGAPEG